MARELLDVGHELGLLRRGRGPAHAPAERDGLAGDLALEGAEDQGWGMRVGVGRVEDVEAWFRRKGGVWLCE